uniref:SLH domain-containing protein n=1 Tax=Zea mays TaxID=4577 RepID=A0A804R285_MAIZE
MAVGLYSLGLSPPPRLDTILFPQLRPHLRRRVPARVAAAGTSWSPAAGDSEDGVGGWWFPEYEKSMKQARGRIGFKRAVVVGLGASAAIALAGLAWRFPSSQKRIQQLIVAPLHYVQEKLPTIESTETTKEDASDRESDEIEVSSATHDKKAEAITDDSRQNYRTTIASPFPFGVPTDPVHEEALSVLKKLQIIEKDVSSSDFCTRKEFARWFVKLCSKFERKKMQRIVPNKLTSGTVQCAFDDVNIDHPDFLYIQSLGESGIISSKLSNSLETLTTGSPSQGNSLFLPDSYLSRFDLVNWKVLVEHPCALEIDQKSRC